LSWVQDLWKLLETVATLTKEIETANSEMKEMRRDLNTLTLAVTQLKTELEHQKVTIKLVLEHYSSDNEHVKESIAAKFDVLTTRLDGKVADFDHRLNGMQAEHKKLPALKAVADD